MNQESKAERWSRLRAAVKIRDGWWAMVFTSKLSIRVVSVLAPTRITPNQVTALGLVVALAAAYLVYRADAVSLIAAAVLVQVAFILDCADGQLARFKQIQNDLGGFYDQIADRVREFTLILAVTAGYHRLTGDDSVWPLGFLAFFILWMLEYYSQQNYQIPLDEVKPARYHEGPVTGDVEPVNRTVPIGDEGFDSFEGTLERLFPFAGFRMGEQLLMVSLFLIGAGVTGDAVWLKWLLVAIILLGGAHAFYRPARRLRAYYVGRKKLAEASKSLNAG